LLEGIKQRVAQLGSGATEGIQEKEQQQDGREYAQEIIESEPGCLSEDFILPAAATRSFHQLRPRKPAQAPQISHGSSLSATM
jgi:hypothetical protein